MGRITASLFAILTALILPALAAAQDYPDYDSIWVNDQAEVLSDAGERRIATELQKLNEDTGVQASVLTLSSRRGYRGETLDDFATGTFNAWGIGDPTHNDGILVLVVTADREIRIELGAGYPPGYDAVAREIIEEVFVPLFGVDAFELGIEAGTVAVIDRIGREHAAGNAPAVVALPGDGGGDPPADTALAGVLAALFAGFSGWMAFGRRGRVRIRNCPNCGQRGIRTRRETLEPATRESAGRVLRTLDCPNCGHHDSRIFRIAQTRSAFSSGRGGRAFGGGSSSGGGASGRW